VLAAGQLVQCTVDQYDCQGLRVVRDSRGCLDRPEMWVTVGRSATLQVGVQWAERIMPVCL
jgi:hypothetical protein